MIFPQRIGSKISYFDTRLIIRKPLFLVRGFFVVFFEALFRIKKIRSVSFHTHYKCNFNCRHCYERHFKRTDKKQLTLEEQKKAIADCLKMGAISFHFIGGESRLNPDFPEIVKACKPSITYLTLTTNGYGYTEEKIRELLDMGIDKLNISIDSFYPEEHDYIRRKKGSHLHAFKTLELCRKVGMSTVINVVVYKNSTKTDGFKKLIEYAIENKMNVGLKLAIPLGAIEAKHNNLITVDDKDAIYNLHKKYPFLVKTCYYGTSTGGCAAFNEEIAITAYGDVLPCTAIHISFGNVREEKIKTILKKKRKIKYFNNRIDRCPSAEDMEFIEKYLSKTYGANPYPIKAEEVFDLE